MVEPLVSNNKIKREGPVVLVIMDGVGYGKYQEGDAVKAAMTSNLDQLLSSCPNTKLKAHGLAVGLPSDDDMGNSEVGHNAMGAGRVFSQGASCTFSLIPTPCPVPWKKSKHSFHRNCFASTSRWHPLADDGNT